MSTGFTSDVTIKLLQGETHLLRFERSFDGQPYDIALRRPQDGVRSLKSRLPELLDPLRKQIGLRQMELGEDDVKRAVNHLNRLAYGSLDVLLEESGPRAGEIMPQLAEFLLPVFQTAAPRAGVPVVEIEAAATDRMAWLLPFEFLPLAPAPTPQLAPRDELEQFLGFRSEIVRFLRGGPDEIHTDTNGRLPVHLFAHAGAQPPGIRKQLEFLHRNTSIISWWPAQDSVPDAFTGVCQLAQRLISLPPLARKEAIQCIAHFSCHYFTSGPDGQGGYTAMSGLDFGECNDGNDLTVRVFDLRGELELQQANRTRAQFTALFFLNACQTVSAGRYEDDTLLGLLRERNATAVVGSETLLPDRLAGEFAIGFYAEFLRNASLSKAMLVARRRLLERFANPAGLFYTFFGNPLLQVSRSN